MRSDEIVLPGEEVYSKYDEAIADIDGDLENVQTAMAEQEKAEAKIARKDDGRKSGALSEAVGFNFCFYGIKNPKTFINY